MVPVDFASQLQRLGTRAQYVRLSDSGRDALDFHIACYLGELPARDPEAFFHVIAVDGGYDPLLQHPRDRKVHVRKHKSIADIPHVKAANSKTLSSKVSFVRESLADRQGGKPTTTKALDSTIDGMFPGGLAEDVRAAIIKALESNGFLAIDGSKIIYSAAAT